MSDTINVVKEDIFDVMQSVIYYRQKIDRIFDLIKTFIESGDIDIEEHSISSSIFNDLGFFFLNNGMYSDAEKIYKNMLAIINNSNKSSKIHRGLALYNLGISQIAQNNFEEGITNILNALEEDIHRVGESKAELLQAAKIRDYLINETPKLLDPYYSNFKNVCVLMSKKTEDLIQHLDEVESLFLFRIILSQQNIPFRTDIYNKSRNFNDLRETCLLLEIILKKAPKTNATYLGGLISDVFDTEPWISQYESKRRILTRFDNDSLGSPIDQFKNNLTTLLSNLISTKDNDYLLNTFLLSHLLRNYVSHYFDDYSDLLENKNVFEQCFKNVINSILYSLQQL